MFGLRTLIPVWAVATLMVVPAEATTSYYVGTANEASFNTAVGGMTLLDPSLTFAAGDLGSGGLFNASGTGINFLGFDDFLYPSFQDDFTVNSGKLTATNAAQHTTISFPPTGIYAFGIHFTLAAASGSATWCVEVTASSCDNTLTNATPASVQFFGIISTTPITASLFIRPQSFAPTIVFTNFQAYGAPADVAVPEPRTILLVGLGLLTLLKLRRTQRTG